APVTMAQKADRRLPPSQSDTVLAAVPRPYFASLSRNLATSNELFGSSSAPTSALTPSTTPRPAPVTMAQKADRRLPPSQSDTVLAAVPRPYLASLSRNLAT